MGSLTTKNLENIFSGIQTYKYWEELKIPLLKDVWELL